MKKVLYILDPRVGNIDNQKYTVDLHFGELNKYVEESEVELYFCGHEKFEHMKAFAEKNNLQEQFVKNEQYTNKIDSKAYKLNYISLPDEAKEMSEKDFGKLLKEKIDFNPDLIIGYETSIAFLSKVFKESKVVAEAFGALSRFPWPALIGFDSLGMYSKSTMAKKSSSYTKADYSEEDKKAFMEIRNLSWGMLSRNFPKAIYDKLDNLSNNKKLLIPLQADGHISFSTCTDFSNHKEMLLDIMKKISPDVDVIITQHPDLEQKTLNKEDVEFFRSEFHNFHYFEELENIPFVSQWILCYCDAVATVSSGVAFQAAILGVPVVSLGNSQINIVASSDLDGLNDLLDSQEIPKVEPAIWKYLKENVFYDEYMFLPKMKTKIIEDLSTGIKSTFSNEEFLEKFKKYSREHMLIDLLRSKNIPIINNELFTKIVECEALSFDLFDTLVERPFYEPHDLFLLAEFKARKELGLQYLRYFTLRRKAEEEARKARNWKETTLEQIYYQLKKLSGLNDAELKKLKEIEIEMEEKVLFQKYNMMRYFNLGKKLGKKVSIITDIYHSKTVIERFLKAVKIEGYDDLLVSADLDLRKHDGSIFPYYIKGIKDKFGIELANKKVLHIGDNQVADVEQAQKFGIRAHHIYKSNDCLRTSELGKLFDKNIRKRWVTDSMVMGMISNRFNTKLSKDHKNSLFGNNLHSFGYIAGGVMMLGFVQYVIEQVKKEKFEKVCFVARDGAILKDIYDMLRETDEFKHLPPSDYLVLSRRATALAVCEHYEDFKRLAWLSFGERRLEELLADRFGLPINKVPQEILDKHHFSGKDVVHGNFDLGRLSELLYDITDLLGIQAKKERDGLVKYLEEKNINGKSNVCLVDIGYSGTIQQNVNKILKANIGGYYFLTHEAPRNLMEECIFDGWLESYDEQRSANYHPLNDYIFLFETLLSSEELSISNYELNEMKELVANYQSCEDEESRIKFIRETHRGILDFTRDYIKYFKGYLAFPKFSKNLAMQTILSLAKNPKYEDANMFLQLNVENSFGGGDAALIYGTKAIFAEPSDGVKDMIIRNSQWKEGARAVITTKDYDKIAQQSGHSNVNSYHSLDLPPIVRKYLKYKKNPYRFFSDSKKFYIKPLRIFYRNK